ncbi:MAG: ABC transporter ATP-binding protein [Planctomycetaceae bacterium]|nr:ABC transporter ATP-binding protein [Planctomycetaceae bacterium]
MFTLDNVTKVYRRRGQDVVALQVPSLAIQRGAYVAMVGASGSGKTTLLSMLGGMLTPTTGTIKVDGISLYDLSVTERAQFRCERIGFVFQTFNLVPYLTALENVELALYLAKVTGQEQRQRATQVLERIGLGARLDHKPCELSTGQQQRVALARTLANDPAIVLADEPTGNLDPESRGCVLDFFDELHREGRTIVMVTHDAVAAKRAHESFRLAQGKVLAVQLADSRAA